MTSEPRRRVEVLPSSPGTEEVELADYLWSLWRHRLLILIGAAACAAVAYGFAAISGPVYQATAIIAVETDHPIELPTEAIIKVRSILQSEPVVERALAGHKDIAAGLTAGTFVTRNLSIERSRDTNLVLVTVRLPDPHAAADVANALAAETATMYPRTLSRRTNLTTGPGDDEIGTATAELTRARAALIQFRTQSKIDYLRARRGGLEALPLEIVKLEARLAGERAALRQTTVTAGNDGRPRPASPSLEAAGPTPHLQDSSGEPDRGSRAASNPPRASAARANIVALEQELVALRQIEAEQQRRTDAVVALELQLGELEADYRRAAADYEQVRETFTKRVRSLAPAKLTVTEQAAVPSSPIAPRPARSGLLGLSVGVVVFGLIALFIDSLTVKPDKVDKAAV